MFLNIVTSGHLGEDQITAQTRDAGTIRITQDNILRVFMRGQYRFFSDHSGFVANIYDPETTWRRPSNFLLAEILFYLASRRQTAGPLGIEGYFSVQQICGDLQLISFDPEDTAGACLILLTKYLVNADHMNHVTLALTDCIKITASGYIHLRSLSGEVEYIYSVLPATRIFDIETVNIVVDIAKRESVTGSVSIGAKVFTMRRFYNYLIHQANASAQNSGSTFDLEDERSDTSFVLRQMRSAITRHDKTFDSPRDKLTNVLD